MLLLQRTTKSVTKIVLTRYRFIFLFLTERARHPYCLSYILESAFYVVVRVQNRLAQPQANMTYSAEYKLLDTDSNATNAANAHNSRVIYLKKVGSAVFYGVASFLITVINKTVLTSWKFPSFLALSIGQMVAGIVILVRKTAQLAQICTQKTQHAQSNLKLLLCSSERFSHWASNAASFRLPIFRGTFRESCFHCH